MKRCQRQCGHAETGRFSNISTITYPHMRHEILNEKENEKVYADVIAFYEKT